MSRERSSRASTESRAASQVAEKEQSDDPAVDRYERSEEMGLVPRKRLSQAPALKGEAWSVTVPAMATPRAPGRPAYARRRQARKVRRARRVALVGLVVGAFLVTVMVAAFGSANTYLASLPVETQAEIYASGPDQVFAGGLYPLQKAERLEGGYRVSGQWRCASSLQRRASRTPPTRGCAHRLRRSEQA